MDSLFFFPFALLVFSYLFILEEGKAFSGSVFPPQTEGLGSPISAVCPWDLPFRLPCRRLVNVNVYYLFSLKQTVRSRRQRHSQQRHVFAQLLPSTDEAAKPPAFCFWLLCQASMPGNSCASAYPLLGPAASQISAQALPPCWMCSLWPLCETSCLPVLLILAPWAARVETKPNNMSYVTPWPTLCSSAYSLQLRGIKFFWGLSLTASECSSPSCCPLLQVGIALTNSGDSFCH